MLDLAIVLALSTQCAPGVSPDTMAAVAHAESRFDPLAIGVNRGTPVRQPRTAEEAARTAHRLIASGASIDLGLAQINSGNLAWLGLSVEAAFDPCRNLAAAARLLRGGFRPASTTPGDRQRALRVALSRYNTGDPERGLRNGYVARVEASAARLGLVAGSFPVSAVVTPARPGADAQTTPAAVPVRAEPGPAWDVFAQHRLNSAPLVFSPDPQPANRSVIP